MLEHPAHKGVAGTFGLSELDSQCCRALLQAEKLGCRASCQCGSWMEGQTALDYDMVLWLHTLPHGAVLTTVCSVRPSVFRRNPCA